MIALIQAQLIQSALSEAELQKITTAHPEVLIQELPYLLEADRKRKLSPSS